MKELSLLNKLITSENISEIMDICYEILGNPLFVVDSSHNILAFTDVDIDDENWNTIVKKQCVSNEIINQTVRFKSEDMRAFNSEKAILIKDTMFNQDQIKKALKWNGQRLGLMIVIPYNHEFNDTDLELADLIGNTLSYKFTGHLGLINQEKISAKTFFSSVLAGSKFSEEQWNTSINSLFKNVGNKWYLALISDRNNNEISNVEKDFSVFDKIANAHAFVYDGNVLMIFNRKEVLRNMDEEYQDLCRYLIETNKIICISNEFDSLYNIKSAYNQVLSVRSIALMLNRIDYIYNYHFMVLFDILRNVPFESLDEYIHRDINCLKNYDDLNKTDMCRTLHVYLNVNRSLNKAADILNIHKNTVNKRINQCKEIMGVDLNNDMEIFSYLISLKILELKESFKRNVPGAHDRDLK